MEVEDEYEMEKRKRIEIIKEDMEGVFKRHCRDLKKFTYHYQLGKMRLKQVTSHTAQFKNKFDAQKV